MKHILLDRFHGEFELSIDHSVYYNNKNLYVMWADHKTLNRT